jgi:hypothetical protein
VEDVAEEILHVSFMICSGGLSSYHRQLNRRRFAQFLGSGEQDNGQEVEQDGTDPYDEVILGRRRPDSVVVDWANKVLFVLEFKRTSDQRRDYRERGETRARAQHDVLIKREVYLCGINSKESPLSSRV